LYNEILEQKVSWLSSISHLTSSKNYTQNSKIGGDSSELFNKVTTYVRLSMEMWLQSRMSDLQANKLGQARSDIGQ
jgi:hypothetical protein